jgi:DnaJ domain
MHGAGRQGELPEARAVRRAHELLGVAADAGAPELTRAYWRQARRLHPDLSSDPEATGQFQALHAAYQLALDAALQATPAPPSPRRQHESPRPADPRPRGARAAMRGTSGWLSTTGAAGSPDNGVWVVAGPVHVQAEMGPDPTKAAQEGRP